MTPKELDAIQARLNNFDFSRIHADALALLGEVKKLREVVVAFTEAFSGFLDHRLAGDLLTEKER